MNCNDGFSYMIQMGRKESSPTLQQKSDLYHTKVIKAGYAIILLILGTSLYMQVDIAKVISDKHFVYNINMETLSKCFYKVCQRLQFY